MDAAVETQMWRYLRCPAIILALFGFQFSSALSLALPAPICHRQVSISDRRAESVRVPEIAGVRELITV